MRQTPRLWLRLSGFLGVALLLGATLWLAPGERTLGDGVKLVMLHVALTWTGLLGLIAAAVMAGLAIWRRHWSGWALRQGWLGLAFFVAGLAMSLIAAQSLWGSVFWAEPRLQASFRFVAVVALGLSVLGYTAQPILHAGLFGLTISVGMAQLWLAPLVVHPQRALKDATSMGIQVAALLVFVVLCGVFAWVAAQLRPRRT